MRGAVDPVTLLVDHLQPFVAVTDVVCGSDGIVHLSAGLARRTVLNEAANAANTLLQFFVFKIVDGPVHHPKRDEADGKHGGRNCQRIP
jgi:hypothetical protein